MKLKRYFTVAAVALMFFCSLKGYAGSQSEQNHYAVKALRNDTLRAEGDSVVIYEGSFYELVGDSIIYAEKKWASTKNLYNPTGKQAVPKTDDGADRDPLIIKQPEPFASDTIITAGMFNNNHFPVRFISKDTRHSFVCDSLGAVVVLDSLGVCYDKLFDNGDTTATVTIIVHPDGKIASIVDFTFVKQANIIPETEEKDSIRQRILFYVAIVIIVALLAAGTWLFFKRRQPAGEKILKVKYAKLPEWTTIEANPKGQDRSTVKNKQKNSGVFVFSIIIPGKEYVDAVKEWLNEYYYKFFNTNTDNAGITFDETTSTLRVPLVGTNKADKEEKGFFSENDTKDGKGTYYFPLPSAKKLNEWLRDNQMKLSTSEPESQEIETKESRSVRELVDEFLADNQPGQPEVCEWLLKQIAQCDEDKETIGRLESELLTARKQNTLDNESHARAVKELRETIKELTSKKDRLHAECENLKSNVAMLSDDKRQLQAKTADLEESQKFYTSKLVSMEGCREHAELVYELFDAIAQSNGVLTVCAANCGDGSLVEYMAKQQLMLSQTQSEMPDYAVTLFAVRMLALTGFLPADARLTTLLSAKSEDADRKAEFTYYIYSNYSGVFGAAISALINVAGAIRRTGNGNAAAVDQQLGQIVALVRKLGFDVVIAEVGKAIAEVDDETVEVSEFSEIRGVGNDIITEVIFTAVNFDMNRSKTKVKINQI